MNDFSTSVDIPAAPEKVFAAINNVRGWWSEQIEGNTTALNDVFLYRFKDVHRCTMQLTELVPNQKITWLVKDNFFNFTGNQQEWIGNTLHFTLDGDDHSTQLHFKQVGLVPANECYTICRDCWEDYIHNSLRNLILTGKGNPNPKED
ncbi:MAG: SRPBCC domain-containing protein [Bacteroidetes bacterium]|nr:SRPBCC domain-containing protein [Bacteroidota bacterium]